MFFSIHRKDFLGTLVAGLLLAVFATLFPRAALAVEPEVTATCVEGVTLPLPYHANTANCEILPAGDSDQFTFSASTGTKVRFNVVGTSPFMDPTLEVRDPDGTVVLGAGGAVHCNGFVSGGCSFSVELVPGQSGTYSVLLYDGGNDETGGYALSLWCLLGDCPGEPASSLLSHIVPIADAISPLTDGDFYTFNATVGTELRFNVVGTSINMDPALEVRDPFGTLVASGQCFGSVIGGCAFSVDLAPALSGAYSVVLFDTDTDETGDYTLSLWCLLGDCDSDADGLLDNDRQALVYGAPPLSKEVSPSVDGDFFIFGGTSGDQLRIVLASIGDWDPTLEIRDPNGLRIINGPADGAQCTTPGCSISLDLLPGITGDYTLALYDGGTDNAGSYNLSLTCLFGTCTDVSPPACLDKCSLVASASSQVDSDGDGFGNECDGDLNNNGFTNSQDYILFRAQLGQPSTPPTYNIADLNANGFVNSQDYVLFRKLIGSPSGPACAAPNRP